MKKRTVTKQSSSFLGKTTDDIVKKFVGDVYYYDGFIMLQVVKNIDGNSFLSIRKIMPYELKSLLSTFDVDTIMYKHWSSYILQSKHFKSKPYIEIVHGVWSDCGELLNIENNVDLETGKIISVADLPKVVDDNHSIISELLRVIFAKQAVLIEQYLALITLQHRNRAKPTLVMIGDRGTGKSFFLEKIIAPLVNGRVFNLPDNFEGFTGFLDGYVMVANDKNATDSRRKALESFAKRVSTQEYSTVKKNNSDAFQIKNYNHLIVVSNTIPITISDELQDELNNQFLVINLVDPLNSKKGFLSLIEKHGDDLTKVINKNIGSYIENVLKPIYKKHLVNNKSRYGMNIPTTRAEIAIYKASVDEKEEDIINMFMDIHNRTDEDESLRLFKEDDFLTTELIRQYKNANYMVSNTSVKNFTEKKTGLSHAYCNKDVGVKIYRGFNVEYSLLNNKIDDNVNTEFVEDDSFDFV